MLDQSDYMLEDDVLEDLAGIAPDLIEDVLLTDVLLDEPSVSDADMIRAEVIA